MLFVLTLLCRRWVAPCGRPSNPTLPTVFVLGARTAVDAAKGITSSVARKNTIWSGPCAAANKRVRSGNGRGTQVEAGRTKVP